MEKICFKCGKSQPLDHFYKHKEMADGHVNKCITCNKEDVKANEAIKKLDPEWVEKERKRAREKYHRLYADKKPDPEIKRKSIQQYRSKYPEKYHAVIAVQRFPKKPGHHLHHWSYKKEHFKSVFELKHDFHLMIHRFIKYDQDHLCYRIKKTGELLDTYEKHEQFLKSF